MTAPTPTTAGDLLVEAARGWLNTPYMHAQRLKGVGVDCIGLVAASAIEIGLISEAEAPRQYSPQPNVKELRSHLDRLFYEIQECDLVTGDLLLFDIAGSHQHVGLYAARRPGFRDGSVIHAYQTVGRVCEHDYEKFWRRRTVTRMRWRAWHRDQERARDACGLGASVGIGGPVSSREDAAWRMIVNG